MSKRGSEEVQSGHHNKKMRRPDEISIKFLLPNVVVGALLSRKAAALKRIRDQTCYNKDFLLKLSGKDQFYPGTADERMISLVGPPPLVHRACCLLQDQIIDDPFLVTDESGTNEYGPRQGQMKIAVSDRAASKIIGAKGTVIRDISGHFNIAISITPAKEIIVPDERVVTILGPSRNVFDALEPIMYQISQQEFHVNPEFDYYSQYCSSNKEEGDEGETPANAPEEEDKAEEDENDEAAKDTLADETLDSSVIVLPEESEKSEEKEVTTEDTKTEPKDDEKSDKSEKPNEKEDKIKKLLKDPRKDGRWVWQSDRSNRPKWVWVEHSKSQGGPPYNYSQRDRGAPKRRGGGRHW